MKKHLTLLYHVHTYNTIYSYAPEAPTNGVGGGVMFSPLVNILERRHHC